jgi:hypothetical protein
MTFSKRGLSGAGGGEGGATATRTRSQLKNTGSEDLVRGTVRGNQRDLIINRESTAGGEVVRGKDWSFNYCTCLKFSIRTFVKGKVGIQYTIDAKKIYG